MRLMGNQSQAHMIILSPDIMQSTSQCQISVKKTFPSADTVDLLFLEDARRWQSEEDCGKSDCRAVPVEDPDLERTSSSTPVLLHINVTGLQ